MMRLAVFAGLAMLALGGPVAAQEGPGSSARFAGPYGGPVIVDANYVASDTCQTVLKAGRGAPPGVQRSPQIIPATVVVGPNPKGCGNSRVVRRVFSVGSSNTANLIEIYFVTPSGQVLKRERIAAPPGG